MITAKQVAKLAQICAEINRKPTKRDVTGDKPTVLFHFFGHITDVVTDVVVDVYLHGWSVDNNPDYNYIFFDTIGWRKTTPNNFYGNPVTFGQIMHDLRKLKEENK